MDIDSHRRRLMQLSLAAVPTLMFGNASLGAAGAVVAAGSNAGSSACTGAGSNEGSKAASPATPEAAGSEHDFDFFLGSWKVHHSRLRKRLAHNHEWEEFEGTSECRSLLGGIANINDGVSKRESGAINRGFGLRAFDAKSGTWADWYLSASDPRKIDVPGTGRFADGVGTFLSDDVFAGKPIVVRGVFSHVTANSFQWEQAFSTDGGKTWETNWVMRYARAA